ncbi:hypothetical protein TD95_000165 [Thielaviopsis punctulata]|uniref:Peptidase S8/S53 domain-containing protein n=1 Tax=Thielaviopsis punctulata TaxID=72032 RepID=A0A0F4Z8L7_9PEZI|nr:hypothetical protein TD95_000165 [Thielaviopsis punctulata]
MLFRCLSLLALPVLSHAAAVRNQARDIVPTHKDFNGYIVEYAPGNLRARSDLDSDETIEVIETFDSVIFSGASIKTSTHDVESLSSMQGVLRVWRNELVSLDPVESYSLMSANEALNYTTHVDTHVQKLHERGIFGKGVKVGVVDTGISYTHEALGGGFGAGFKVAGGWDFVGDGQYPLSGSAAPDSDPMDMRGHGTHVAGIIGGSNSWFTGVAPEAELYAYKVFSMAASTDTQTLIKSFLQAYDDGMDIITASIGGSNGWSDNAWAEVASRLVDEGVIVTISAGNSGASGPFYGSSGSSGTNVIAVASTDSDVFPATPWSLSVDGDESIDGYIPSSDPFPAKVANWPIVPMSLEHRPEADGCEPYPKGTASLEGKIALVRRGTCTFETKQKHLTDLGAEYILIYNTQTGALTAPSTGSTVGSIGMIGAESGEAIVEAVKAGKNVTGSFTIDPNNIVTMEKSTGGFPSSFTSWASLSDLQIKPDIAAPGGGIYSTYLDGTWQVLSGTSMACPYVAGVAALYVSVHGGREVQGKEYAKAFVDKVISSGKSVPWYDGSSSLTAPVGQIGSGLIDAVKILDYTSQLVFDKIALNDTTFFNETHEITVLNNGDEPVTYNFTTQANAGFEALAALDGDYHLKILTEMSAVSLEPVISLPESITVEAGSQKTVAVVFSNPKDLGWNTKALPVYSGKVIIQSSLGEQMAVPYQGVAADLKTTLPSIFRQGYPTAVSGLDSTPLTDKSTFNFDLSVEGQSFPKVRVATTWGTREGRWDIFDESFSEGAWTYPLTASENGYIGSVAYWSGSSIDTLVFDASLDNKNSVYHFPLTNQVRSSDVDVMFDEFWWFGRLTNGSYVEPGSYNRMRFAYLKPFGDRNVSSDWDILSVPTITIGEYTP